MRRDLFIPAAAFTATIATGLALVVLGLQGALRLVVDAGIWVGGVAGTIGGALFVGLLVSAPLLAVLTDRDRKRRVRETRGMWR